MKRPALQNKQVGALRMAFRARKVFRTFEKRALADDQLHLFMVIPSAALVLSQLACLLQVEILNMFVCLFYLCLKRI